MQSPPKPWTPGVHPTYTSLQLVLNICQDEFGNVWSDHTYASSNDEALAASLKQGGAPEIAHALMVEALRREVFLLALVKMSQDSDFLQRWKDAEDEERLALQKDIEHGLVDVVTRTAQKGASSLASGVLTMLTEQM